MHSARVAEGARAIQLKYLQQIHDHASAAQITNTFLGKLFQMVRTYPAVEDDEVRMSVAVNGTKAWIRTGLQPLLRASRQLLGA